MTITRERVGNFTERKDYRNRGPCDSECADGKLFGEEKRVLSRDDLFLEGSSFRAEDYTSFFYQGGMDRCAAFGYEIEVVSIAQVDGEYVTTVQITRTGE